MTAGKTETTLQAVRRHLRNGYVILTERGAGALYGAAMREAAKLVDQPVGVFLAPRHILRDGPAVLRGQGLRATIGAVLRQIAAEYDPPLGRSRNPVNAAARASAIRHHYTYELTKPDGVVPARRPVNDCDFALEVPFTYSPQPTAAGPIAAVVHAFYPETLPAILARLGNIPLGVDLFVSTDTPAKRQEIERLAAGWSKGSVETRIVPNRGRDIAAKFVGFLDVYDRYDLFIHLHTKKSPHGGAPLARWLDYLLDNLVGSPEIARAALALFDDPKVGVVFPQHLFEIRGILNWGYDYEIARGLMRRLGVEIDKNHTLEFPSGSMFWGRSAAIRGLLDLGLRFEDFPDESGQVDGTLAHAIERIVLTAAEARGFEWMKIVRRDLYPLDATVLPVAQPHDIAESRLKVFQPCLAAVDTETPPYARQQKETRLLAVYPSRNPRPRLNLLVPSVNPLQTFGGVATALRLFGEWADALGEGFDRRVIVTDAEIEPAGYATLPDYAPTAFAASHDLVARALVDASERGVGRLDLRARDVFVASAWWTARLIRNVEMERARIFGGARPFAYLIQDDEPHFYGWSSKYALAEATYRNGENIIAVINSEELYAVMTAKYAFRQAFCLPYELNAEIARLLSPRPRERTILVYGRQTVHRNGFELICDALTRWQQSDPIRASRWDVVFLGESFVDELVYPVQNASIEGKVSLADYADRLGRASVGVSLMFSPHPSYPPLEMAQAGLIPIANSFPGKNLRARCDAIVALDDPTPENLAKAIEQAVARAEPDIGAVKPLVALASMPTPGPRADAAEIARLLREAAL
ncbi:MAG: rhamnan synthesis F family protein [Rhodoblastus sp.]